VTVGNSLENHFLEYLAVTSHYVRYQECQQIFVPSWHFLILERTKNLRGLSQVNKVDGLFLLWISQPGTRELLTHRVQGHCHGRESTCQAKVRVFSSEQIPITLSALPNNTLDSLFVLMP
jgi:hypothetical protein